MSGMACPAKRTDRASSPMPHFPHRLRLMSMAVVFRGTSCVWLHRSAGTVKVTLAAGSGGPNCSSAASAVDCSAAAPAGLPSAAPASEARCEGLAGSAVSSGAVPCANGWPVDVICQQPASSDNLPQRLGVSNQK